MAKLAIKGCEFRGNKVIGILEILGGRNTGKFGGTTKLLYYYIDENGEIKCKEDDEIPFPCIYFTLDEFLEKFPYKVGDKVIVIGYKQVFEILSMRWCSERNDVLYSVSDGWFYTEELQPYKEETMKGKKLSSDAVFLDCSMVDKIELALGNTHEVVVEDGKTFIVRKKPQYPKTYEECCKVLGYSGNYNMILTTDVDNKLFDALYRLKVCRDAYWKIAGEQMGLGKPWKTDWNNICQEKWFITTFDNTISYDFCNNHSYVIAKHNHILTFPTKEMRDAFLKNFKEEIEQCKELL